MSDLHKLWDWLQTAEREKIEQYALYSDALNDLQSKDACIIELRRRLIHGEPEGAASQEAEEEEPTEEKPPSPEPPAASFALTRRSLEDAISRALAIGEEIKTLWVSPDMEEQAERIVNADYKYNSANPVTPLTVRVDTRLGKGTWLLSPLAQEDNE